MDGTLLPSIPNNGSINLPQDLHNRKFSPNIEWRIFKTKNGQAQILVATDASDRREFLGRTFLALGILWPALTALMALATFATVSSSFKPLERMLAQAKDLGLSDRLETGDKAEFGELAKSVNAYLDRIEMVVRQQEEFAVDAAHELCTPLTALRGQLELALLKKADAKEFAEAARRSVAQVTRLERLVESLLLAARPKDEDVPTIDVQALVEEAQARWVDRYAEKQVNLDAETQPYRCAMRTEELECVLENLLANALRYSPAGTRVTIELTGDGLLHVQDEGPGIAVGDRERVFERFERGTTVGRGFGIGLYLARRLLSNRDGRIGVVDSTKGTRIEIVLPQPRARAA
jgi:two-component system sensor histidine kinase TctE